MIENLPKVIPIFPLKNILFLPEVNLPLYIFEERYLNMTSDVLNKDKIIGMIQIEQKTSDNQQIYKVGCAGKIIFFEKTTDNKFLIILKGVSRFKIKKELSLQRGYRRIIPNWENFKKDINEKNLIKNKSKEFFLQNIENYLKTINLKFLKKQLEKVPINELIHIVSREISLTTMENQSIIETINPEERLDLIIKFVRNFFLDLNQNKSIH